MVQPAASNSERRLDSWKEIAAFFGRDERTVRRWEKDGALPVHRVPGSAKGRVFAYEGELDLWLSTPQAARTTTLQLEQQILEEQILEPQISELQPEGKPWRLGAVGMWVGTLAVCAGLAAGIWFYRKSHRFAAYASTPVHAKDLRQATGVADPLFGRRFSRRAPLH